MFKNRSFQKAILVFLVLLAGTFAYTYIPYRSDRSQLNY
jgi:hypothetical protein